MAKKDSQNKLYTDLVLSNKRTYKGKYETFCSSCGKTFTFDGSEIKDQVVKCPFCKFDNVFFYYEYK